MKQILPLILTIFILNGCGQIIEPLPCKPQPCTPQEQSHVKIPTFKAPASRPFKIIEKFDNGTCLVQTVDLYELAGNNKKLRSIYHKQTAIAVQLNKR